MNQRKHHLGDCLENIRLGARNCLRQRLPSQLHLRQLIQ